MIGVLNYGVGNVNAFLNVYKRLGINAKAITKPSDFYNVSHLILPGVGSFDNAINKFNESGLRIPTEKMILYSNIYSHYVVHLIFLDPISTRTHAMTVHRQTALSCRTHS